jgi:hypothetical protein
MLFLSFFLGVSFAMMKFRPTVERPKINKGEKQRIDELGNRLKDHVTFLAETIGERNLFIPENLHKAAFYIHTFWQNLGYEVKKQAFLVDGLSCENLSIEIPGQERPEEIILLGAHYDSVVGSPGANDNGSAVASLLEISRLFNHQPQKKTVRLVAFTNEEPPFFQEKSMGSRVYAQRCREQKEKILAMVSLETIGYYSEVPKSQQYPPPLNFFYPDKGNFLGVVGNIKARKLVKTFTQYFMERVDVPVECVAAFGFIPGIEWSDHSSFWKYGYPAIMVTDTALYRYPYYHTPEDTPDKIDYPSLSRVTYGIFYAAQRLAQ